MPTYNLTMRSSREYPGGLVLANGKPFFGLLVPVVEETYESDSVTLRFERVPGSPASGGIVQAPGFREAFEKAAKEGWAVDLRVAEVPEPRFALLEPLEAPEDTQAG